MNGILRKGTLGIAWEGSNYGTSPADPSFFIPATDLTWEEVTEVIENNALMGSTYEVNDTNVAYRLANYTITTKIHEDLLPIFLLYKFGITSDLVPGETAVYKHTLEYLNTNAGGSYSLYWNDPDRRDLIGSGVVFESVTINGEAGQFVNLEVVGKGRFPVVGEVTIPVARRKEFTGGHLTFKFAKYGDDLELYKLLTIAFALNTPLSDESENVGLGSFDLTEINTLADRFELQATSKMPDYAMRTLYKEKTDVHSEVNIMDTGRFVTGSVANTNPSIQFINPIQSIIAWARTGGADELVKQDFTLLNLAAPGVTDAPMKIVVTNSIQEYMTPESS